MAVCRGYHFVINPGPINIPDRVSRAMDRGAIDFNGAQFRAITEECLAGLNRVSKTDQIILAYAASGHGAWEAALVNLFWPGYQAAGGRKRLFLDELGHARRSLRARGRDAAQRLADRRRPCCRYTPHLENMHSASTTAPLSRRRRPA